jgi:hypothetical protein
MSLVIPVELIEYILNYLNIKDSISFLSVNKYNRKIIDSSYFWSVKLQQDYNYNYTFVRSKKPSDYTSLLISKYQSFFKTLCTVCTKKTVCIHPFYKILVCKKCEVNNIKYKTVCQSYIFKNLGLIKKDLENVIYHKIFNRLNSKRPIKMYLLSNINTIVSNKFPNNSLKEHMHNKNIKTTNKCVMYMLKYNILRSYLSEYYYIDRDYINIINYYSNSVYKKYIKNISKINHDLLPNLINCYRELDFIMSYDITYNTDFIDFDTDYFDTYLEKFLIMSHKDVSYYINEYTYKDVSHYIIEKIQKVLYSASYNRRQLVQDLLNKEHIDLDITTSYIYKYIYFGQETFDEIKYIILEQYFITTNFNYLDIIYENICLNVNKFDTIKKYIHLFYNNGGDVPDFLKLKYNLN